VAVGSGVGLLAAGSSALQDGHPKSSDLTLVKVGIAILTVCWIGLCFVAAVSWRMRSQASRAAATYRDGSIVRTEALHSWSGYIANIYHRQLLNAAMTTLAFIGIRVVYSLVTICTQNPVLNPISGSLAARVVLSFLPEIISTLLLVVAGILTRNVRRISKHTKADK